jgi:hypothetical protein
MTDYHDHDAEADRVASAYEAAGARIAAALTKAALSGEDSFRRLAKTALEELARIALAQAKSEAKERQRAGAPDPRVVLSGYGSNVSASPFPHDGQIAAAIARAVVYGRRNL